ncbi:MAG: tetratricopeptide repeat protein [Anaerolineae bacterium]
MEPDLQKLLNEGIAAARAGQKEQAQQLLLQVTDIDETNLLAWLWLSGVVKTRSEQEICLENVLTIDPQHQVALHALARLRQQPLPAKAVPPAPPSEPPTSPSPSPARHYQRVTPTAAPQSQASAKAAQVSCPFCRKPASTIATVCPHCKLPLSVTCPACGAETDVEQKSCAACHQSLGNYHRPVEFFSGLGLAYQENERYEDALKAWQAVEIVEPDYPDLYLHLGETQVGLGRLDRATRSFEQALKANPDSSRVHYAVGEVLRQRGEIEQAYPHYLKVTTLDPKHGLAWLRLGQLYEQARRSKDATQAYQRAAKLLETGSAESLQVRQQLAVLRPSLPEGMMTGWAELTRQMSGPVVVCLLAVLVDSGLRPWWISWSGWVALLVAVLGAFLWVSGDSLPRNPLICQLVGQQGLSATAMRWPIAFFGLFCWLFAFILIMMPIGQTWPEPPNL